VKGQPKSTHLTESKFKIAWKQPIDRVIYTNDKNNFQIPGYEAYDKFDVLLNNHLVLSDMNQDQVARCPALYDLGRKEARILVTGSSGESINIVFRLHMGPDHSF